jgi:hypothetical protein
MTLYQLLLCNAELNIVYELGMMRKSEPLRRCYSGTDTDLGELRITIRNLRHDNQISANAGTSYSE